MAAVAEVSTQVDDATEESTDTCPLHGAECPVWATLGADS